MSEIKVNSIKGVGASTAAITVNNTDGTCTANITNNLSNRRLNINGQMTVWQRGTSITSGGYSPDRYYQSLANAGSITHTISQQSLTSSDTPYSLGFRYFQRHALSGAGTANANANLLTQHTIEAQDMAQSGWDYTSTSSYLSISFWVRVSTSQKFYLNLRTRDGTSQAYNIPFTPSANTWTKVTAQVAGNSNLQFDTNNDKGLHLNFYKFVGTDSTGGSSENAWAAYDGNAKVPDMASTWLTAGASTFDLTGLQVEVSDHATDFEFLSFADELRRCQRYYYLHAEGDNKILGTATLYQDNDIFLVIAPKVTMRAAPTVDQKTGTNYYRAYNDGSYDMFDSWGSTWNITDNTLTLNASGAQGVSLSGGGNSLMIITSNSGAKLAFSAEL